MATASARLENDEYVELEVMELLVELEVMELLVELEVMELLEDPKVQALIKKISDDSGKKGAAEAFNILKEESSKEARNAKEQSPEKTNQNIWKKTKSWVSNHKKAVFIAIGLVTAGAIIYSLKPGPSQDDGLDFGEQADMSEAINEL